MLDNKKLNTGRSISLMPASMSSGNPEILEILKEHGAEVAAQNIHDKTLLSFAAEFNDTPEIIDTLLDFGADPDIEDKDGLKAVDHAREIPI
ncbi:MAG: ankyrin repeat domain-containing protein [Bacillota bacterium]